MITPLRALVRKDLQVFFADRRAVIMSFIVPIAIASFFGFVMGGRGGESKTSRIAIRVTNHDDSKIARQIVDNLSADKNLEVKAGSEDESRDLVRTGKAVLAVTIPIGFGAAAGKAFFGTDNKPELQVLYDPSHSAELGMVRGILTEHVMQAVSGEMFNGQEGREMINVSLAELEQNAAMPADDKKLLREMLQSVGKWQARAASQAGQGEKPGGLTVPYQMKEEAVTAGKDVAYNGFAHAFAGMGVQFMLLRALENGVAILTERQRGLWKRLRAAPLSRFALLAGRALSGTIIALMVLLAGFGFARIAFGVRIEGSVVGFFAVSGACSLMASAFGLLIASLGKTPEATRGLAIFATLMMVMLGGAWVPAFLFPSWLQKITLVVPTRWAVDGLDAMTWRGLGLSDAAAPVGVLLGFAVLFGLWATLRFRWEQE